MTVHLATTLPLIDADPVGGIINYDWKSYADAEGERIRATVYILDSRLRADGVKVSVFRQILYHLNVRSFSDLSPSIFVF